MRCSAPHLPIKVQLSTTIIIVDVRLGYGTARLLEIMIRGPDPIWPVAGANEPRATTLHAINDQAPRYLGRYFTLFPDHYFCSEPRALVLFAQSDMSVDVMIALHILSYMPTLAVPSALRETYLVVYPSRAYLPVHNRYLRSSRFASQLHTQTTSVRQKVASQLSLHTDEQSDHSLANATEMHILSQMISTSTFPLSEIVNHPQTPSDLTPRTGQWGTIK
ncbi:hypothetical protein RHS04_06876 [Rhizoctonia solani]|uniref:Uncharacterized protein n=1 Tax=Rhizoctonia solani TaxID=456999 RepID=A0A8H7H648_9AGAM|nr:hypothetical protein RHS04_06876 [Rhizoctonia solani]